MTVSFAIWISVCLVTAIALAGAWRRKLDRGLICLRWYLALALTADVGIHLTLLRFGYRSAQYKYAYYLGDLAVVIFGFFVLARLVELAFERSTLKLPGLRTGAVLVFSGLATCSAAIVYMLRGGLSIGYLGRELEQNFSFLGMILAILLFAGMNLMHVRGIRFRRLVLSFSLLYAAGAIVYSLEVIIPGLTALPLYLVPMTGLAGMALIAYSLWVPEAVRAEDAAPVLATRNFESASEGAA